MFCKEFLSAGFLESAWVQRGHVSFGSVLSPSPACSLEETIAFSMAVVHDLDGNVRGRRGGEGCAPSPLM